MGARVSAWHSTNDTSEMSLVAHEAIFKLSSPAVVKVPKVSTMREKNIPSSIENWLEFKKIFIN
jgi:hypothetical protein